MRPRTNRRKSQMPMASFLLYMMRSENALQGLADGPHPEALDLRDVLAIEGGEVAGRQQDAAEAQGLGLLDPDEGLADGADLTGEADLAEKGHVLRQGHVLER